MSITESPSIEIYFQIGFHREALTVQQSDLDLTRLKGVACWVVEKQVRCVNDMAMV